MSKNTANKNLAKATKAAAELNENESDRSEAFPFPTEGLDTEEIEKAWEYFLKEFPTEKRSDYTITNEEGENEKSTSSKSPEKVDDSEQSQSSTNTAAKATTRSGGSRESVSDKAKRLEVEKQKSKDDARLRQIERSKLEREKTQQGKLDELARVEDDNEQLNAALLENARLRKLHEDSIRVEKKANDAPSNAPDHRTNPAMPTSIDGIKLGQKYDSGLRFAQTPEEIETLQAKLQKGWSLCKKHTMPN